MSEEQERTGSEHVPRDDEVDDVTLTADGCVDGSPPEEVVRTHVAELWFTAGRVYKRKRPVDLGFVDFTTLEARERACRRELALNRRLVHDVYLGLADVRDADGLLVDRAVVMRRLPDERRLSARIRAGGDVTGCLRGVARRVATFHAAQPPAEGAAAYADVDALATNWSDNLAVLREHPDLVPPATVAAIDEDATRWLRGRGELVESRLAEGLVRDGHGDLLADDVFCLDDGPRILDCLEFTERYRIADVLLDAAFLAMDLERLGRPDLAEAFLDAYGRFTAEHHPAGLADHFVAYRASVRAKVACLRAGEDPGAGERARGLADLCARRLARGRVRLVLVGGLPGTGKSTLATALSDRLGWVLLRSDEIRKDLGRLGHREPGGPGLYRPWMTGATYAELHDRARGLLRRGESVVLDASWADRQQRAVAAAVADQTRSELVQLRCVAPDATARERLERRTGDVSDADPAVHATVAARFDDWPDATPVDTTGPPGATVSAALGAVPDLPVADVRSSPAD